MDRAFGDTKIVMGAQNWAPRRDTRILNSCSPVLRNVPIPVNRCMQVANQIAQMKD